MTVDAKFPQEQEPNSEQTEPDFSELVAEFLYSDARLRMAYSKYLDHQSRRNSFAIGLEKAALQAHFLGVIKQVVIESDDYETMECGAEMIGTLITEMTADHAALFDEYSPFDYALSDDDKANLLSERRTSLVASIDMTDPNEFIDAAHDQFQSVQDMSTAITEQEVARSQASPRHRTKEVVLKNATDIAKMGAAVALGMVVRDKLLSRK